MTCVKNEFTFPSASGLADIHAASYLPEDISSVKAVLQIAHGMAEHLERYEKFADRLCENGIAVFINDHLGHGKSVKNDDELGFFGKQDGYKNFIADCHKLYEIAKEQFPDKPYFFFGHSMGSFVARNYTFRYADELDGAIFCGTSGPNPAAGIAIGLASAIASIKGDHYRSKFIDSLAFGAYNKRFEGRTPFDWLSRDQYQVDKYIDDKYCGFLFTACGYRDLFSVLKSVSGKDWSEGFSKKLPVFLISGAMDPVGNYGKGVTQVYDSLKAAGKDNVRMKLYENGRHEILNEDALFDTVCEDIVSFVSSIIG